MVVITDIGEFQIKPENASQNDSPRPQHALRSYDGLFIVLIVLTGILFSLLLFSILQQNLAFFDLEHVRLLSFKILDTNTAASLFVTLIGAILVRHQFALGIRPAVNYTSANVTKNYPVTSNTPCELWQVVLHNAGSGTAILNSIRFRIGIDGIDRGEYSKSHKEVVEALAEIGLVRDQDYSLANVSAGSTLAPRESRTLFEIKASKLQLIKQLDASIQFKGVLGDKYGRELFLIPREIHTLKA